MTSTLKINTIEPEGATTTLTVGESGQNTVIAGAEIKANVAKDAGANAIFTSNGSGVLSGVNSAFGSAEVLITTTTISSPVANVDFTSGIDSTYKEYVFEFVDIHPSAGSAASFSFQCNAVGGSGWDEAFISGFYVARASESGSTGNANDVASYCQNSGTDFQYLAYDPGDWDDAAFNGVLHFYNPADTALWKYWYGYGVEYALNGDGWAAQTHWGGVVKSTAAIDEFRFQNYSGNIDAGSIKLWGIK